MKIQSLLLTAGLLASLGLGFAFARPSAADSHNKEAKVAAALKVDPVHSAIFYRIKHMNTSWSYGRFDAFQGTVTYSADAPEAAKIEIEVMADSINTGNKDRDEHLKSPEFFDVKQFKTATFKSKKVAKAGAGLKVTGDFSLHGVTKEVTLDIEPTGMGKGMKGETLAGFHGTLSLKRSDFGITTYPDALGDDVQLTISLECSGG